MARPVAQWPGVTGSYVAPCNSARAIQGTAPPWQAPPRCEPGRQAGSRSGQVRHVTAPQCGRMLLGQKKTEAIMMGVALRAA